MNAAILDYFLQTDLEDLWRTVQSDFDQDGVIAAVCRKRGLPMRKSDYSFRKVVGSRLPSAHQDVLAGRFYGITQGLVLFMPEQPLVPSCFTGFIVPGDLDDLEIGVKYSLFPFAPVEENVSLSIDTNCEDLFRGARVLLTRAEQQARHEGVQRGQPTAACIRGECGEDGNKPHRFYLNRFQLEDLLCWLSGYFPD